MPDAIKISLIAFMFVALGNGDEMVFSWYQRLIKPLPWYIRKPIGGCYICFTGEVCFWFYLISRIVSHEYNLLEHLFFVFFGIMCAMIYHKLYCWLK